MSRAVTTGQCEEPSSIHRLLNSVRAIARLHFLRGKKKKTSLTWDLLDTRQSVSSERTSASSGRFLRVASAMYSLSLSLRACVAPRARNVTRCYRRKREASGRCCDAFRTPPLPRRAVYDDAQLRAISVGPRVLRDYCCSVGEHNVPGKDVFFSLASQLVSLLRLPFMQQCKKQSAVRHSRMRA